MDLPEIFLKAMSFVEQSEGGTNTDPLDRGGLTKFGISEKTYPDIDIENLTPYDAKYLYYDDFWMKNRCGEFQEGLAIVLFDTSVNCGQPSAAKWLQLSCNKKWGKLQVDGIVGQATVNTVSQLVYCPLMQGILAYRLKRYSSLLKKHPEQMKYIRGWVNRVSNLMFYTM